MSIHCSQQSRNTTGLKTNRKYLSCDTLKITEPITTGQCQAKMCKGLQKEYDRSSKKTPSAAIKYNGPNAASI